MSETIITALIGGAVSLLVCVIANKFQNDKMRALLEYKVDELIKKQDKHNSVIERTFKLEETVTLHAEQIKVANNRIKDLENKQ